MENLNRVFNLAIPFIAGCLVFSISASGQLNLVGTSFSEHFITPETMNQLTVNVEQGVTSIIVEAKLTDRTSGTELMKTSSNPVAVKPGLNAIVPTPSFFNRVQKGGDLISSFIAKQKRLPSGRFEQCVRVYVHVGEYSEDVDCKELEVITNEFLRLVSPVDQDTIEEKNPMLIWTTSAFDELNFENKIYRMVLAHMGEETDPERALNSNPAQFVRYPLKELAVMHPASAPELRPLESYAWRVEVLMDGVVVNRSESWKFTIAGEEEKEPMKYATLRHTLGGTPYEAIDEKLYFSFSEQYKAAAQELKYEIKLVSESGGTADLIRDPVRSEELSVSADDDFRIASQSDENHEIRQVSGLNRYELDLSSLGLSGGIYILEVWNGKGETERMKFRIK